MAGTLKARGSGRGGGSGRAQTGLLAAALIIILSAIIFFKYATVGRQAGNDGKPLFSVAVGINNSLKSTPLVIADKTGCFKREGISVTMAMESSAAPLLDRMIAGELDVVCAPEQLVAFLALERDDFRILAALNRSRSHELIINTVSGAYSPLGLKGRRIGLKMDSAALYFLYRKLLFHDIALADVELVDLEPDQIPDKLAAGEIDAAIVWPPYTHQIYRRLGKNALAFDAHIGRDMYWLLVAREAWCRNNGKAMESFLVALQAAFDYMETFPEEAMATAGDYFGFPAAGIRQEWGIYYFELELPQSLLFAMEQEAKWWQARMNMGGKPPDFFRLVELRPLANMFPDKVTIIH